MDLISFMIEGPHSTPYENGLFIFDIHLPPDFPFKPPSAHYISFWYIFPSSNAFSNNWRKLRSLAGAIVWIPICMSKERCACHYWELGMLNEKRNNGDRQAHCCSLSFRFRASFWWKNLTSMSQDMPIRSVRSDWDCCKLVGGCSNIHKLLPIIGSQKIVKVMVSRLSHITLLGSLDGVFFLSKFLF